MSNSDIQKEVDLRIQDITQRIRELENLADSNDINFSLSIVNKEFYCSKYIEDDEWLNDCHGGNGGQWLSSSDFC